MFLGHSTNEVGREEDVGASDTSGQTALFVCSQISANMKNLQQELRGLTSAVRHLQSERSNQEEASRKNGKKSVAKGLPGIVHDLYKELTIQFESRELFASDQNQRVACLMHQQVYDRHKENYTMGQIKTAVHRYYESRRRRYNDSLPHRIEKVAENKKKAKRKGYQDRLYHRRDKVIRRDEERIRTLWDQIGPLYMTEESSDDEGESIKLHHLQWESDELQELKQILDDRIKDKEVCTGRFTAKPRIEGSPSTLPIPHNAVQWAVKSTSNQLEPVQDQTQNDPIEPAPIHVPDTRRGQHSPTEPAPIHVPDTRRGQYSPTELAPIQDTRRYRRSPIEPAPIPATGRGQCSTISPSLHSLLQQQSPQISGNRNSTEGGNATPRRPRGFSSTQGTRNCRISSSDRGSFTGSNSSIVTLQRGLLLHEPVGGSSDNYPAATRNHSQFSSSQVLQAIGVDDESDTSN